VDVAIGQVAAEVGVADYAITAAAAVPTAAFH
jgi:hypothetical protein